MINYSRILFIALVFLVGIITGCTDKPENDKLENWYLGYRMVSSLQAGDLPTAQARYDSLWQDGKFVGRGPMVVQFALLMHLSTGDTTEALRALDQFPNDVANRICRTGMLGSAVVCDTNSEPGAVTLPDWQRRFLRHHIYDQGVRGHLNRGVASELGVDTTNWQDWRNLNIDSMGRALLRDFVPLHGFPTVAQIGKDGMDAVFLIIQHADQDPAWQAAQLPAMGTAFERGDIGGNDLAMLTDRVRINAGQPQLYGTQVVPSNDGTGAVGLLSVADSLNLDRRRMEMGMVPINHYLRNFSTSD
ncbi:MAG: DUF6624 domain-containing protein [Lewinella sp.]